MNVRDELKTAIAGALGELGVTVAALDVPLEHPTELQNGDYSSSVALKYAKDALLAPRALAEKLADTMGAIAGISKVEVAGPGFINFYISSAALAGAIEQARSNEKWGENHDLKGKKMMVEYTDPNPFKEFHIGHLMSNAIGESIARLLEYSGAEVKRANYQGDVGPHVAKALWGKRKFPAFSWGEAYAAGAQEYEKDPAVKEAIDAINKKVYDKTDRDINALYDDGREASLAHFENIYQLLGTTFDFYFFESVTAPLGQALVEAHPEVFEKSDGATVYRGEEDDLHTRVFITSKGLPTYETKELGLAELKAETWDFDTSITVTAHEQRDYFAVVLAAMRKVLPDIAVKIKHVTHGMMRFAEGKMSSRTGNVVTGESLLSELKEAALERAKESRAENASVLAEQIAVAAIKYQVLKQASGKDIIFDRVRALSLEGDSGPYLQYAHARACAVVEKAKEQGIEPDVGAGTPANDLARLVHRFPEKLEYAARELEPHLLTTYLLELASAFNSWYAQVHILDGTPEAARKVALVDAVRATLAHGLQVLGIPAPEKM